VHGLKAAFNLLSEVATLVGCRQFCWLSFN
jgi:hypothetical protein